MISEPLSQGRRQVLVYKLDGGGPLHGVLKGLTRSGLSLTLPMALQSGEVVRLIMPPSDRRPSAAGRTIIGHVVGVAAPGNLVGIEFAWEVGIDSESRSTDAQGRKPWWCRLFARGTSVPVTTRPGRGAHPRATSN
jgi:hypothetical protein